MSNQTKCPIKKLAAALAVSALFITGAAPASAAIINFDDIASPGASSFLAPGYQGFTWLGGNGSNSWVITDSTDPFYWGFVGVVAHSGQNYAWSNGATDLSMGGATFDFNSFWGRGGATGDTPTAHGFIGATEVYTQSFTVSTVYQLLTFNFLGIDRLTITNQHANLLLDDITVNGGNVATPVPEPETWAMLLAGLGLLGFTSRRKKNSAA
jgi:hypothetical protein